MFREHILVKESGTSKPTPSHQDLPYYCVEGNQTDSYWIPLDPITKDNTLQVLLGSHLWPKLVRPSKWSTNASWFKEDAHFMQMPNINEGDFTLLIPELKLVDDVRYVDCGGAIVYLILFNFVLTLNL